MMQLRRQDVHRGRANELGHKDVSGRSVKLLRRAHLFDFAVAQDNYTVRQRHRLDLIVGNVDHRRIRHGLLQFGNLDPGRHPQRSVEIGQRFVKEKDPWITNDGAPDCDPLALPA